MTPSQRERSDHVLSGSDAKCVSARQTRHRRKFETSQRRDVESVLRVAGFRVARRGAALRARAASHRATRKTASVALWTSRVSASSSPRRSWSLRFKKNTRASTTASRVATPARRRQSIPAGRLASGCIVGKILQNFLFFFFSCFEKMVQKIVTSGNCLQFPEIPEKIRKDFTEKSANSVDFHQI